MAVFQKDPILMAMLHQTLCRTTRVARRADQPGPHASKLKPVLVTRACNLAANSSNFARPC